MRAIVSWIGRAMFAVGICGYISVIVQFIVFRKESPAIISVVFGALLIFIGYALICLAKKNK